MQFPWKEMSCSWHATYLAFKIYERYTAPLYEGFPAILTKAN
jgi:hypothetical protein